MSEISPCITLVINQCFASGILPNKLKMARVLPIYKENNNTLPHNYCQISILPTISTILENVMHSQLLEYFSVNKLLSSQQYGFQPNRSTETAALELMDRNITAMNDQLTPINIYLDLSNAFDTIVAFPNSKHGEHGGAGYTGRLFRRRSHVQFSIQPYTY